VVHVDEEPYNLTTFLAMRDARRVGARSVFFTWQNLARRYPPPFSWFERSTFRSASSAIAGNADAGEVLRGRGYSGPISIIPQFGVDPDRFRPPAAPPDESGPFVIGYLGRLVEEKGLLLLVEALVGLGQEWRVELYGHGPLRPALEARAAELGLSKRVFVRPPVPSTEVSTLLGRMHVLALPSLTRPNWKEQFGRVLVEAMACGVPVIGSDSGEIPNVIGSAGLVFPEGSVAGLRDCLEQLLVSAARRRKLATLGRARVLERFTHQQIAAATVEVYRQMTT
jgi:glycosyltransferase involved in cell wall biosynthesis